MYVRRFKEKGLADVELIAKRVAEVSDTASHSLPP